MIVESVVCGGWGEEEEDGGGGCGYGLFDGLWGEDFWYFCGDVVVFWVWYGVLSCGWMGLW